MYFIVGVSSLIVLHNFIAVTGSDNNSISIVSNSIQASVLISHSNVASIKFKKVVLLEPLAPMNMFTCSLNSVEMFLTPHSFFIETLLICEIAYALEKKGKVQKNTKKR